MEVAGKPDMFAPLRARRDTLRARLDAMPANDPARKEVEAVLQRLDLMLSPVVPSPKAMRKLVKAQEDMDGGILVATIPYGEGRELRVFVKHGPETCDVCIKLYHRHRGLRQMVPTSQGMTLKGDKLGDVIDALNHARQYVPTTKFNL